MSDFGSIDVGRRAEQEKYIQRLNSNDLKKTEDALGVEKVESFEKIFGATLDKVDDSTERYEMIERLNNDINRAIEAFQEEARMKKLNPLGAIEGSSTPDGFEKGAGDLFQSARI